MASVVPFAQGIFTQAYFDLMGKQQKVFEAGESAIAARELYERAKARAMLDGTLNGSNDAKREEQARQMFAEQYEALRAAERDERKARFEFEAAKLQVERLRAELRLSELISLHLPGQDVYAASFDFSEHQ